MRRRHTPAGLVSDEPRGRPGPVFEQLEQRLLLDGGLAVYLDQTPNVDVDIISDTQIRVTNHNLALGYAVDVYKNGQLQEDYCLPENNLLGMGFFSNVVFGTKTQTMALPQTAPGDTIELDIYAEVKPENHPRHEFSEAVAWSNMGAALTGFASNALSYLGMLVDNLKVAQFAAELLDTARAQEDFNSGDLGGGFGSLASLAASKAATSAIIAAAGKADFVITQTGAAAIARVVAVAFSLPTVWDSCASDLQQSMTLLHHGDILTCPRFLYQCE